MTIGNHENFLQNQILVANLTILLSHREARSKTQWEVFNTVILIGLCLSRHAVQAQRLFFEQTS